MGSKKIATLWDNKESDDHEEHRENQAFYAGGSEHSGQQILGPNRDSTEPSELIENLFHHARQSAASHEDQNQSSSSGSTTLPIVFWRNGFTVGNASELREYASADSRHFLDCLRRGETPPELANQVKRGMIDVKLDNKAHMDFVPERKTQAFSGEGHRLGAITPETVEQSTSTPAQIQQSATGGGPKLVVDESEPATNLQVRLNDNTRLIVRINLTGTVGDVVSHIRALRPEYSNANFVLATTFPAKDLTDLSQTISDAKLANAAVIQKIKR